MKRTLLLGALLALLAGPYAAAQAHSSSNVSVSVSTPEFGIRIGGPVYAQVPVYAPQPVYVPAPVYAPVPVYAPAPVYVAPRVIYPAPVYYGRPGAWVAPRPYRYRHVQERREVRRDYRYDHNGNRAGYGF
jgi:hypothetical protein